MIRRLLIANRGEIAVRVARACRELGVESVAVFSDADATAPHVRAADRAVRIGPAPAHGSYLSIPAVVGAARAADADAVHPGYGFLAENPDFAEACAGAGLIFVGPPADVIARMGSKIAARTLMEQAGVPVVPGVTPDDQSDEGLRRAARALGFPLLIKASAGGGGKGMRAVRDETAMTELSGAARREAHAAFGDGTLYVERLLDRPRHVEFQILADDRGGIVHLFERECSVQRRHQKIVEESPSPALTPELRARMGAAAVAAGRAAGYRNAGTIEFLLEGEGDAARFYFLEMNTRLQVEHPVTEAVTGVDLVQAQLRVASGEALPWTQAVVDARLAPRGHAVECRLYAESPRDGFLPQAGAVLLYREPHGPGIRVDSGIDEGSTVPVHYDPLLAKLVACAENRSAAIARAAAALERFAVLGLHTNGELLLAVLRHPAFASGRLHTEFVDEHLSALLPSRTTPPEAVAAAALFEPAPPAGRAEDGSAADPWATLEGWR
jgi:acetyl-CoA carboxylase biotin carboxylase subunit